MKKIICIALAVLLMSLVLVSCDSNEPVNTTPPHVAPKYADIDLSTIDSLEGVELTTEVTDYVVIDVAEYGKIVVRLFPDVAPESVANFKKLVASGAYDGLIFHRVIDNFMIQGGGYTQGSDALTDDPVEADTIRGEFTQNGFVNNLKHTRGVLSMARTNAPNSASNQFFICHKTSGVKHLDGAYASFGFVVYGLDVVDDIANVKTNSNDQPLTDVVIASVKFAKVTNVPAATTSTASSETQATSQTN